MSVSNTENNQQNSEAIHQDDNHVIAERREKLKAIREAAKTNGGAAFPNDFKPEHKAAELHAEFGGFENEVLDPKAVRVSIAGRMMLKRVMGKASFATVQDSTGRIQLFISKDNLSSADSEAIYEAFKHWDLGDIIAAEGVLFKTKTGELSVKVSELRLLTKSLRPLPEKFHGLQEQEVKYRQRYVDLIVSEETRATFVARSKVVAAIRNFMTENQFLEVETPMLHPIPGGASAKPFITHHNALDMQMFMRIAPELYLKRLVVGGFDRVFEVNRNFRNEGLSVRHNPEFTMLEYYQAYADYHDLMDQTEELFQGLAREVLGSPQITYQGVAIDLGQPFARLTMLDAIRQHAPQHAAILDDPAALATVLRDTYKQKADAAMPIGSLHTLLFEEAVEHQLVQPTFITAYPSVVSPLARRNDDTPDICDRFELFIGIRFCICDSQGLRL